MKFYEFGNPGNPTIMCLPGNFMTHRQYEIIVPLLENAYHIITVSFDGYDETGETVYTSGEDQARKLAAFIRYNLGGRIDLVYAESLGSIPALFLPRIKGLQIGSIIVSGAEYMNDGIFNGLAIRLFAPMTYKLMTKILRSGDVRFPAFLKIKMGITDDVFAPMLKQACQALTLETTKATFAVNIPMASNENSWALYLLNLEHPYESLITVPTCTDQGYTTHSCPNRGHNFVDSRVDATGHLFGEWSIFMTPTCTEPGQERRDCGMCAHFETREIPILPYLPGDLTGDDQADSDDAIWLLYSTLFGEKLYPLNQSCDFDGSGAVDSDDVIYLLFHTLFGEPIYPLH